ncbi:ABC transporter permease subunit [Dictyobacter aurantiacus]|uniref:ABC transporter permease n=1 Tax=Dictyobacter aurantiacus TaxID=1936993 RepID=A0A401ZMF1_9CHLR|nr:ABC transporter permease subunit [Dictyobacter aurantiacus]GCE07946.1 hypothetical protein KDAU_52750 [Dictyobacter aurantiacus]
MLWRTLQLEKDKVFGRPILWIELGILTLIIALIDCGQYVLAQLLPPNSGGGEVLTRSLSWPMGLVQSPQFAASHSMGGILLTIIVAVITAREYSWRTFHLWLSRGVSRLVLIEAKCIVNVLLVLTMVIASILVSGILTAILTLLLHGSLAVDGENLKTLVINFLITDYALLPYVALAFMLTIISRSSILAIGVGLAFILLVESVLHTTFILAGGTWIYVAQYLPMGLEASLREATKVSAAPASPLQIPYLSPALASAMIALYVAVLVGITIWRFLRQNFTD